MPKTPRNIVGVVVRTRLADTQTVEKRTLRRDDLQKMVEIQVEDSQDWRILSGLQILEEVEMSTPESNNLKAIA